MLTKKPMRPSSSACRRPAMGSADADVVLARVAGEQELEGGQQGHEGGDPLTLAEGLERLGESPGEVDLEVVAAVALDRGPGLVGGQLESGGGAGELLPPVGELLLEGRALQPLTLPDGVVSVLQRQLGQGRGLARGEGLVEGRYLAHEDAHGPAVGDDVVHGEERGRGAARSSLKSEAWRSGPWARSKGRRASSRGQPVGLVLALGGRQGGEVHECRGGGRPRER